MKRFYCTICHRVKRVQRWPATLENQSSEDPKLRVGACNRHYSVRAPRRVDARTEARTATTSKRAR